MKRNNNVSTQSAGRSPLNKMLATKNTKLHVVSKNEKNRFHDDYSFISRGTLRTHRNDRGGVNSNFRNIFIIVITMIFFPILEIQKSNNNRNYTSSFPRPFKISIHRILVMP